MRQQIPGASGTQKVRRGRLGGKRAPGHEWQKKQKRVRRADARRLRQGPDDSSLSGVGGLIAFNAFLQEEGIGRELRRRFARLKQGHRVVYPMHTQLQLLIDAAAAGAQRVFDLECLAPDPIFEHLAGGAVPSIDTVYKDLARFDKDAIEALEALVAEQGLRPVASAQLDAVTVDIDTTVMPLFGCQEGARLGPNPRYHGRPSYHPILARVAEFDTILGARLRPGDTSMGDSDVEDVTCWIDRLREVVGPNTVITVRVDAGADCSSWFEALDGRGVHFIVKARQTAELLGAATFHEDWAIVDRDADGQPTRRVAVLDFRREDWPPGRFRVIAVRTTERYSGRQTQLWEGVDDSVQFFVTNDLHGDPDEVALRYDARAAIEGTIRELKEHFAIGSVPTGRFDANEAAFLIKVLAFNLLRRWVLACCPEVSPWRASWVRRLLICIPARLLRAQGRFQLRLAPRRLLN